MSKVIVGIDEWRDIPGLPGYQASRCGLIRSIRRAKPVLLKPEIDKDGYFKFQPMKDGVQIHFSFHRAVALAYIGPASSEDDVVCHNDGSRSNNSAANLRWGSQKDNIADKKIHGTTQEGSRHPRAICDEKRAKVAKEYLRTGASLSEAAIASGLTRNIVADISRGRTWKHVVL